MACRESAGWDSLNLEDRKMCDAFGFSNNYLQSLIMKKEELDIKY